MGILKGGVQIKTGQVRVVYSEDPDVRLPAALARCGWVPESAAIDIDPCADIVTVQALSPAQYARYRDVCRSAGTGSALHEALRMGVAEVVTRNGEGRRVVHKGKGCAVYVDALVQQAVVAAELLGEVIHHLSQGNDIAAAQDLARHVLGAVDVSEEVDDDGATFRDAEGGDPA